MPYHAGMFSHALKCQRQRQRQLLVWRLSSRRLYSAEANHKDAATTLANVNGSKSSKPASKEDRQPSSRKGSQLFDLRRNLENINIRDLSDIVSTTELKMRKMYQEPDLKFKSLDWPKRMNPSLKVSDIDYAYSSPAVGDVVQLAPLNSNFGMSLIADLAVIVKIPLFVNDQKYLFLTRNGIVVPSSKAKIQFRLPKVFDQYMIRDMIMPSKDTETTTDAKTLYLAGDWQTFEESVEVPKSARKLLNSKLSVISERAWRMLPEVSQKLSIINKLLQANNVQTISIFELERFTRKFDLTEFNNMLGIFRSRGTKLSTSMSQQQRQQKNDLDSYLAAYQYIKNNLKGDISFNNDGKINRLGKGFNNIVLPKVYDSAYLYAIYLGIKKQTELWFLKSSSVSTNTRSPLFFETKPLTTTLKVTDDHGIKLHLEDIIKFVNDKLKNKDNGRHPPQYYQELMLLIKDYSAGNITDRDRESFILNFLRRITIFGKVDKVNRTCAFFLLQKLDNLPQGFIYQNPNLWNISLKIPNLKTNVDLITDLEQSYFDSLSVEDLKDSKGDLPDPIKNQRVDFGNLPVYCIDAETAHEIDDGLSIERKSDSEWWLHIHIADPASYFTPDSTISKIALKRTSTVYLAETVIPMLPSLILDIAGLGIDGQPTRTITYSIQYNPLTKEIIKDSAKISGGIVRNFPKVTYNKVDEILASKANSQYKKDLDDLLTVSKMLRQGRVKDGALIIGRQNITVQLDANGAPQIIKESETDSKILVSELMILANSIAGNIFANNKVPAIFRNLDHIVGYLESRKLSSKDKNLKSNKNLIYNTFRQIQNRCQNGETVSFDDFTKIFSLLKASSINTRSFGHNFLGLRNYNPSTSPLRRYGDLVSHWQTHGLILEQQLQKEGKSRSRSKSKSKSKSKSGNGMEQIKEEALYPFRFDQLAGKAMYIQNQGHLIKKAQRESLTYWKIIALINLLNDGQSQSVARAAAGDSNKTKASSVFDLINVNYNSPNNQFEMIAEDQTSEGADITVGNLVDYNLRVIYELGPDEKVPVSGQRTMVEITNVDPVDGQIVVKRKKN